jgi:hypothetical protein
MLPSGLTLAHANPSAERGTADRSRYLTTRPRAGVEHRESVRDQSSLILDAYRQRLIEANHDIDLSRQDRDKRGDQLGQRRDSDDGCENHRDGLQGFPAHLAFEIAVGHTAASDVTMPENRETLPRVAAATDYALNLKPLAGSAATMRHGA